MSVIIRIEGKAVFEMVHNYLEGQGRKHTKKGLINLHFTETFTTSDQ